MMTGHMMGLLASLLMVVQDPGEIFGGWDKKPDRAVGLKDLAAEAAEESRLLRAVAAAEAHGADHLLLAGPLEELAVYYMGRKRIANAEPLLRRVLAIREANQGPDHVDVANSLLNLASCRVVAKRKRDDTAGPMLQRALDIFEKRSKDDPEVARTLRLMAMQQIMHREYDAAESKLSRALAIQQKAAGPDSAEAAEVLYTLGVLHTCQAKWDVAEMEAQADGRLKRETKSERHGKQAETFLKRALAIREEVLEPNDPDIARSLKNLAGLALLRERPADGEPYLERWLKLQEAARAPASEEQADCLEWLAIVSQERKDWAQAERRLAKSQAILEALNRPDPDQIATVLSNRADVAVKAVRFDDAEAFLKRGLEICTARLGPNNPEIVQARALMAGSYRDHVDDRRAPLLWVRVKALSDKSFHDHDQGNLWAILANYADLLRRSNRVLPPPTEEDLAYLEKVGISPDMSVEDLLCFGSLLAPSLDDASLAHFARLYELQGLNLKGITDAGLAHIKDLVNLRELSIVGTGITDAGLRYLEGLESLERLYIGGTRVTVPGVERLRRLRPGLSIEYDPNRVLTPPMPSSKALAPSPPLE